MNRRIQCGVLAAAMAGMILLGTAPRNGSAQVADALTIGAALGQSSGAVDDIVRQAGNEANYVVFSAAAELRVMIENLRLSARDVLDEGFSELNNSQQQVFDNVQKGIASLRRAIDEPIEQGRQTVEQVHQMVNDVAILGKQDVTVIRSRPSVIAPSTRAEIPFTVRGLSLDEGSPRLFFGNVEARRVELVQQQAIFSVPASVFQHHESTAGLVSGRLLLTVEECTWWIVNCDDVEREFRVAVMTLPSQVAKVTVSYNRKGDQRVYRDPAIAKNFGYSTGDLTHMKCTTETQAPHAPGYFIDTESLSHRQTHGKARNRYEVLSVSPGGFAVRMCAQSQVHNFKKRSGEITVHASWREYRMENVVSPEESMNGEELTWGGAFTRTLPSDAHAVSVRLDYFDKSSKTFIGNGADRYLDVSWNAGTKQLLVTPKQPTSIADFG